jgi:outer membrane murein-binding lipoprotein Lpp
VPWIPLLVWLGAVVFALVVLGFCAYEIVWKARRLQSDVQRLMALGVALQELQGDVVAAQQRLARAGVR